jgi:DNA (cytosine-5)-methyltransferase 1
MFGRQGTLAVARDTSERGNKMQRNVREPAYSAISLYCGAGGLDLGFSRAEIAIDWAIDHDPLAIETYNANLDPCGHCGDILSIDPPIGLNPDLVIGGPPCQGFSVIGRMNPSDPRSRHVDHFFEVVETLQPRGFVLENVKALATSGRWEGVRRRLLRRASSLGYQRRLFILNAQEYGVPQSRERMFLVGLRDGIPERPPPTSPEFPPTVREALAQLPDYGSRGNDQTCAAKVVPARNPILRPTAFRGSLLFNGSGRPLELDAPAKTLPASMGGNATPILDQDELDNGSDPWVVAYHRRLQRGGRPVRRAPDRLRRITVDEAAVLQTFPAEWSFAGSRVAQYRQIGNAVPPMLAQAVGESIRRALADADGGRHAEKRSSIAA